MLKWLAPAAFIIVVIMVGTTLFNSSTKDASSPSKQLLAAKLEARSDVAGAKWQSDWTTLAIAVRGNTTPTPDTAAAFCNMLESKGDDRPEKIILVQFADKPSPILADAICR